MVAKVLAWSVVPAWPVPWSMVHGCSWQIHTAGFLEPLGGHDDINEHFTKDKFECNCINSIIHGHVNFQGLEPENIKALREAPRKKSLGVFGQLDFD